MHVVVIHDIADADKFWQAVQQAGIPEGMSLHRSLPSREGNRAVCHWEARSVEELRDAVESTVGQYSRNEYFAVDGEKALGL